MNWRELSWSRRILVATLGHPLPTAVVVYLAWSQRPGWWPLQIVYWLGVIASLVAAEALGQYWLHNPYAERLMARTAGEPVSSARLGYLIGSLLAVLAVFALAIAAVQVLGPFFTSFASRP
jgi:hypothetical protein